MVLITSCIVPSLLISTNYIQTCCMKFCNFKTLFCVLQNNFEVFYFRHVRVSYNIFSEVVQSSVC